MMESNSVTAKNAMMRFRVSASKVMNMPTPSIIRGIRMMIIMRRPIESQDLITFKNATESRHDPTQVEVHRLTFLLKGHEYDVRTKTARVPLTAFRHPLMTVQWNKKEEEEESVA